MPSNFVKMIEEIGRNIENQAGTEVKDGVMQGSEKITSSTKPEKVAVWVKGAMDRLDGLSDQATREQIMNNCGYNCALHNKTPLERGKARRNKYASEDDFLTAEQEKPSAGTRLVRDGDTLYQFYTPQAFTRPMRCYCGLLRGLPAEETVSLTYCQCSRGFVQKYWEYVLGKPVQVEILESAISGAKECKFAIHLKADRS